MRSWMLLLLLIFALVQQESKKDSLGNKSDPPLVTYCELVENPEKYHDKVVRFKASAHCGWHECFFYDLACDEKEKRAYAVLSCDTDEACEKLQAAFSQKATYDLLRNRIELVAIGKFKGSGEYGKLQIGSKGFRFQLEITKIEKTFPVPEKMPWPK